MTDHAKRPLYLMVKPPPEVLPRFARERAALGIDPASYSLDRLHSTFLRLGETSPATLTLARRALDDLRAEPFAIGFDSVDGNLLKGCKGLRALNAFQRKLAGHMLARGCPVIAHSFWLHLCLTYTDPVPARRLKVAPIGWTVDEIQLIESVHGQGRHIEHGCRRLHSGQGAFNF
jgi:2'-5' RNA ligase